jgi:hypothetical protein
MANNQPSIPRIPPTDLQSGRSFFLQPYPDDIPESRPNDEVSVHYFPGINLENFFVLFLDIAQQASSINQEHKKLEHIPRQIVE